MAAKDPVTAYAKAVTAGRIVAGKAVRLACARHLRDLEEQKKRGLKWELGRKDSAGRWDVVGALTALDFFHDMLVLEDGSAFELLGWQGFVVGSLFGWYGTDGARRFRTAYVETGKGSGKTPLAAGIGIYCLVADGEHAPEVYSAATSHRQAGIVFQDAMRMVDASPELRDLIKREVGSLSIPARHSVFRAVSSEHRSLDGMRVHAGLIDELHEHPSAIVVDKIRAGTKGRKNALLFEITNSGYDRHSVCWQHHEYSLKVLEGVIENETWFAFVCGLDEGDRWDDEKVWPKANPSLPVIPGMKYLREQVAEAQGMPSKENIVRRLNMCEWTEQAERAIPMDWWAKGAGPVDAEALRGRQCYGGLDLARVNDLSSLVLLFPPMDSAERWKLLCWFWVPEDDIGVRAHRDRVPYDVWVRQGLIEATAGNTTDYAFIEAKIVEVAGIYKIGEIAYDRTFAGEIVQNLIAEGLAMVEFGQGFLSMASPTAELLRLVKAAELQHGGNAVLTWMASNLAVRIDPAGNMKPDKERSLEKIDGISALCNALGVAAKGPKPEEVITSSPVSWA